MEYTSETHLQIYYFTKMTYACKHVLLHQKLLYEGWHLLGGQLNIQVRSISVCEISKIFLQLTIKFNNWKLEEFISIDLR